MSAALSSAHLNEVVDRAAGRAEAIMAGATADLRRGTSALGNGSILQAFATLAGMVADADPAVRDLAHHLALEWYRNGTPLGAAGGRR